MSFENNIAFANMETLSQTWRLSLTMETLLHKLVLTLILS